MLRDTHHVSALTPKQFGKYLLFDKIAVGGMAELYRAKIKGDLGFEKLIAIKRILPHLIDQQELISAFIDEAKLAALLQHPNIIQIYDFGSMEDAYFIAMEYLFGKDLERISKHSKENELPVSLENALYIASRICDGLNYAHNLKDLRGKPLNIIHRDISPQNIFITYEGQVKIIDFGIAKAASQSTATQAGIVKGKVSYMSPEQAAGKAIDHRSDLFSAGILLYEMVTHKRMFQGDTFEVLSQVANFEFDPPGNVINELPARLNDILHMALSSIPEKRYPSGAQMKADIDECIYELSYRPSDQGIARYMNALYGQEISLEEQDLLEAIQINVGGMAEHEGTITNIEGPEEKPVMAFTERVPVKGKKKGLWVAAVAVILIVVGTIFAIKLLDNSVPDPLKGNMAADTEDLLDDRVSDPVKPDRETEQRAKDRISVAVKPDVADREERLSDDPDSDLMKTGMEQHAKDSVSESARLGIEDSEEKLPDDSDPDPLKTGMEQRAEDQISEQVKPDAADREDRLSDVSDPDPLKMAMVALKEERFDEAVAHFESVLKENPSLMDKASIHYSQALIGQASKLMNTDPEKAQASLLKAVELNPHNVKGHSKLGLLYIKQKEYQKAIDAYKKRIELDGKGPKPFFNLGYIYMMNEDYENAKEMYSRVVELAPVFLDEALFNLAFVNDKLGEPDKSIENLQEAIAFNPNNEQAKKYLRRLERRAKR